MTGWLGAVGAGLLAAGLSACDLPVRNEAGDHCRELTYRSNPYVVCSFDAAREDIRLFYTGDDGVPYLQFDALAEAVEADGGTLVFAMNGGMYHDDRRRSDTCVPAPATPPRSIRMTGPAIST